MGGRGTFAAGNPAQYSYQTVDAIEGVKVLVGVGGKHSLPEEAHSSSAYIKLKNNAALPPIPIIAITARIKYAIFIFSFSSSLRI